MTNLSSFFALLYFAMKDFGCILEFSQERMDELLKVYYAHIEACSHIRMPDVYAAIVEKPASRFWVSPERAATVVFALMSGKSVLDTMRPTKRAMFTEIYRRVRRIIDNDPSVTVGEAVRSVVEQPAPSFYLAPHSAKALVCKARRQWVRRRMSRLKAFSND